MEALDHRLLAFHNAVRHLGSSVGLFVSAVTLRERIKDVLKSFREQSSLTYPGLQEHDPDPTYARVSAAKAPGEHAQWTTTEIPSPRVSGFSSVMEGLALDLESFLDHINQISEFAEEGVNNCVTAFVADIRYWSSSLHEFNEDMHAKELSYYIHDLTGHMGKHIVELTIALNVFIEVGVPTIRLAQQQQGTAFLNLSTVSTLLSGVSATTIQFTYSSANDRLQQSVNLLWIVSLTLSIASAINSQLAYYWGTNKFRSPRSQVPWWGFVVITQAPLYFLLGSVVAFSSGLVCFTFSAFPHTLIPTLVSLCTALTITSLIAVVFWLVGERWAFMKSRGRRWLISYVYPVGPDLLERAHKSWFRFVERVRGARSRGAEAGSTLTHFVRDRHPRRRSSARRRERLIDPEARPATISIERPSGPSSDTVVQPEPQQTTPIPSTPRPVPSISVRMASEVENLPINNNRRKLPVMAAARAISRLTPLPPEHKHAYPVLSLAFSPDGRTLASGSWDSVLHLWDVRGPTPIIQQTVTLPRGPLRQVYWSPDGASLLGRLRKAVFVWDMRSTGPMAGFRYIGRHSEVRSVRWMPSGRNFLMVQGSDVAIMAIDGSIVATHTLARFDINDIDVTKDGTRLIVAASVDLTAQGFRPSDASPERRLLVYNLETREIEDQVPMVHHAQHITLSNRNDFVLVTYPLKEPQLFRLSLPPKSPSALLAVLHSCHYPSSDSLYEGIGPCSLGALTAQTEEDQIIACAAKDEIRLWDRESGRLFGTTGPQDDDVEFTCAAWNHGNLDTLMLAAGGNDGTLRFWKGPLSFDTSA